MDPDSVQAREPLLAYLMSPSSIGPAATAGAASSSSSSSVRACDPDGQPLYVQPPQRCALPGDARMRVLRFRAGR